jgi:hypothetical protein
MERSPGLALSVRRRRDRGHRVVALTFRTATSVGGSGRCHRPEIFARALDLSRSCGARPGRYVGGSRDALEMVDAAERAPLVILGGARSDGLPGSHPPATHDDPSGPARRRGGLSQRRTGSHERKRQQHRHDPTSSHDRLTDAVAPRFPRSDLGASRSCLRPGMMRLCSKNPTLWNSIRRSTCT